MTISLCHPQFIHFYFPNSTFSIQNFANNTLFTLRIIQFIYIYTQIQKANTKSGIEGDYMEKNITLMRILCHFNLYDKYHINCRKFKTT